MVLYIIGAAALAFWLGWSLKDYMWIKAAKNKTFMHFDGKIYLVRRVRPIIKTDEADKK